MPVFKLTEDLVFPPPQLAGDDGLLAVGGDLSEDRLLLAYQMGIFPWYSPGEPILWWAPSPRLILEPFGFRASRRLARTIRQGVFEVTMDQAFRQVMEACAAIRRQNHEGTWIDQQMVTAYCRLHERGYAHSVECWRDGELAGGLYGVALGVTFFGESMFSRIADSSKVALAALARQLERWDFDMIDCQMKTGHLVRLGAREIPGREFRTRLQQNLLAPTRRGIWHIDRQPFPNAV